MFTLNNFVWFLGTGNSSDSPTKLVDFARKNVNQGRYFNGPKSFYNTSFGLNSGRSGNSTIAESEDILIAILDKEILNEPGVYLSPPAPNHEHIPVTALVDIKKYVINGKTYYTQLDPLFIQYLNSSLELSDMLPHNIDFTLHNQRSLTGSNAQANKDVLTSSTCWVDKIGSIALLDTEIYQEKFKQKFTAGETCSILKTINCYKGNTPSFAREEQPVANLTSGTRLFLYTSLIEVWKDEKRQFVPFLGLAIFGGEKLLLWKNSLELLTTFQKMVTSLDTIKILYPEKYAQVVKSRTSDLTQYWKGMKGLVPEKVLFGKNPYIVNVSTLRVETSNELKPFFLKAVLNKTPEASGFLALEMKALELAKQEESLRKEVVEQEAKINRLRKTLIEGNNEIARLQQLLIESQQTLTSTTETFIALPPKLVRLQNAAISMTAALEPLKIGYNKAIDKYWDEPVSLDIVNAWAEEILIEKIIVTSAKTGESLNLSTLRKELSQPATAKQLYISKVVLTTTKPTIIYQDAHTTPIEKCKQVLGGPYRIMVTSNVSGPSMQISLLDDRSFRGLKLDNYKSGTVWTHPHTPGCTINLGDGDIATNWTRSTNNWVTACLGEAQPILHNAMKDLQIAPIIYAVKGWLQTANSTDGYGCNVKYFPSAEGVKIEPFLEVPSQILGDLNLIPTTYDKQLTFTKTVDENILVTIIIYNTTKMLVSTGKGTLVGEKFSLTLEETKTLFFTSTEAKDLASTDKVKELTDAGYTLYSTKHNLEKPILEFVQKATGTPSPVEEYVPANKRRISDVIDMISRMQQSQEARA